MRFFDLHCDTITRCCDKKQDVFDGAQEVTLRSGSRLDGWCQCFAIFIDDKCPEDRAFIKYKAYVEYFDKEIARHCEYITHCRNSGDIGTALEQGKCAAVLTLENAAALGGDMENIRLLAANGVKAVTLTWNGENSLGYGSAVGGHLKPFGREAAKEIINSGMAVDVSHLSDEGFCDILKLTDASVFASHSNLRDKKLSAHPRNLTADQLREIAARGGVAGLNLHRPFLSADDVVANNPETLLRHADRMLEIAGEDAICIGSDFDGAEMPDFCRTIGDIPALFRLFSKTFGERIANKVFFENANNFFSNMI